MVQNQLQMAKEQQQFLRQLTDSQNHIAELLSQKQGSTSQGASQAQVTNSTTDPSAKSSQFYNLSNRLGKFVHDPSRGKTFSLWYERHAGTFEEGSKGLTDDERKELLLTSRR